MAIKTQAVTGHQAQIGQYFDEQTDCCEFPIEGSGVIREQAVMVARNIINDRTFGLDGCLQNRTLW